MSVTELTCWRWLPGMLTDKGYRIIRIESTTGLAWGVAEDEGTDQEPWPIAHNQEPDTDDPATQGAIVFGLLAPLGWRMQMTEHGHWVLYRGGPMFTDFLSPPEAVEAALRLQG